MMMSIWWADEYYRPISLQWRCIYSELMNTTVPFLSNHDVYMVSWWILPSHFSPTMMYIWWADEYYRPISLQPWCLYGELINTTVPFLSNDDVYMVSWWILPSHFSPTMMSICWADEYYRPISLQPWCIYGELMNTTVPFLSNHDVYMVSWWILPSHYSMQL